MKTHFKAQKLGRQGHYFGGENQSCAVCKTTSGQEEGEKKINQSLFGPRREYGRRDGS